jgi:excisionase family DNA binding protein
MTTTAPIYLTQSQVAEILGVSARTLEMWRVRGGGPQYRKLGARCVRYTLADIEAWISARTTTTAAAA